MKTIKETIKDYVEEFYGEEYAEDFEFLEEDVEYIAKLFAKTKNSSLRLNLSSSVRVPSFSLF